MSAAIGAGLPAVLSGIAGCRACAEDFAATATAHSPRPVVWCGPGARIVVAGQAPGRRVHASGVPFSDASGRRLREWMGVDEATFYDRSRIAILPMAFCFPGQDGRGADMPPPSRCAALWRSRLLKELPPPDCLILVGGHAQRWHLGAAARGGVTRTVADWAAHAPRVFPLPHPSWRNTAWLTRNPWFQAEVLPALRRHLRALLQGQGEGR